MTAAVRLRRAGSAIGLLLAMVVLAIVGAASPARAEYGDHITSYGIDYVIDADGTVHVTETIDYVFAGSGRHGIYRDLLTRVKYDDTQDRVYEISNLEITSPTGASTETTRTEKYSHDRRTKYDSYRIGSASATVGAQETYVLKYDVAGALNAQQDADTEFYWNATGNQWDAQINKVDVTVRVPGGATQVACWAGAQGTSDPCDQANTASDGTASFTQSTVSSGEQWGLTIDVGIDPAKVSAEKILEDRPTFLNQNGFTPVNAGIGAVVVAAIAGYGIYTRRESRDKRFAGVPPGVVPDERDLKTRGNGVGVVPDDGSVIPPVAFSPPRGVSPAEASYLRRPGPDADQLSATILDLAQRGAVRVIGGGSAGESRSLQLVDPARTAYPHEKTLLSQLFEDSDEISLSSDVAPGVDPPLYKPGRTLRRQLGDIVDRRRWFTRELGGTRRRLRGLGLLLLGGGAALLIYTVYRYASGLPGTGVGFWGVVGIVAGAALLAISRTGRGQGRTAVGRAVMDQVDGFEIYLRTAEADQLRFEEGEDIFSKYLPWAVVFDVTERWTRVCAELSAAGRIPSQPGWYYGPWDPLHSYIWISALNHNIGSAAAPPTPVPSASSPGSSGFSGFGGGGFSGGGGGGGGGGSW
ncbi:DUF2207 domain-containing protein [Cumulibacter manganitolerans]|uniref:DUF2207 domain-containing protein n=1 Tax=Cumulibacter manganitolerans TaxID=1884992 RepID=UPI0012977D03|nr:DUF2207 domain-containing protein [Cumulibacter manganitolerans]